MDFSERLAELGIELPPVAAPVAAYIPATRFGDVIRTSGQLPLVDGALPAVGKVGSDVPAEDAKGLAREPPSTPWPRLRRWRAGWTACPGWCT